jgi:hypothetical protein
MKLELKHETEIQMTENEFDGWLVEYKRRYADVFTFLRGFGWTEQWRPTQESIQGEPWWPVPFPRHPLADRFVSRFAGLRCRPGKGWPGVAFGCYRTDVASSLKEMEPYDVERYLLREENVGSRPPAFPIGSMNDWMLLLREDWSTIAVSYRFRKALLTTNPFEMIYSFLKKDGSVSWDVPERYIELEDYEYIWELPDHLRHIYTL